MSPWTTQFITCALFIYIYGFYRKGVNWACIRLFCPIKARCVGQANIIPLNGLAQTYQHYNTGVKYQMHSKGKLYALA